MSFDLGLQIVAIDGADCVARDDFEIRLLFDGDGIVRKANWISTPMIIYANWG